MEANIRKLVGWSGMLNQAGNGNYVRFKHGRVTTKRLVLLSVGRFFGQWKSTRRSLIQREFGFLVDRVVRKGQQLSKGQLSTVRRALWQAANSNYVRKDQMFQQVLVEAHAHFQAQEAHLRFEEAAREALERGERQELRDNLDAGKPHDVTIYFEDGSIVTAHQEYLPSQLKKADAPLLQASKAIVGRYLDVRYRVESTPTEMKGILLLAHSLNDRETLDYLYNGNRERILQLADAEVAEGRDELRRMLFDRGYLNPVGELGLVGLVVAVGLQLEPPHRVWFGPRPQEVPREDMQAAPRPLNPNFFQFRPLNRQ